MVTSTSLLISRILNPRHNISSLGRKCTVILKFGDTLNVNEKENNRFQFSCLPTKITTHWNFIWWRENKGGGMLYRILGGSFLSALLNVQKSISNQSLE